MNKAMTMKGSEPNNLTFYNKVYYEIDFGLPYLGVKLINL